MEVFLSAKKTAKYLGIIAGVLVAAHIVFQIVRLTTSHGQLFGVIDRFDLDNEASIPTWFSQILLFISSALLSVIAAHQKKTRGRFVRHWWWLAGIFAYLSIDEGAMIHEMLIDPVKHVLNISSGFLGFAWVIPFGILLIVLAISFITFIKNLPKQYKFWFILSGLTYVLGALGMEMIGSAVLKLELSKYYYLSIVCIEESLEMTGIIIFIFALLSFIKETFREPLIIGFK